MSEQGNATPNAGNNAGATDASGKTQPVFAIEKIYVRDLSVEVPNAPKIYLDMKNPKMNVHIETRGQKIDDGIYEVALTANVSAKLEDERTVFMVEVAQCGIFQLRNIPDEEIEAVMMIGCANILFPYARETVSDALTRAGFQPVLLNPVNFEAMYRNRKQRQQTAAEQEQ